MKEEFLSAHNEYADALFRHCFFRVHDRELAKDLTQEAFCRTWVALSEGKEIRNIRAFLYRVLHNLIVDEIRKKKPVSLEQMMEDGFSPSDTSLPSAEERLATEEVFQTLASLEEPHRSIMLMRFVDGLSPSEISAIVGVSENTVSVRVHRGVAELRRTLKHKTA